MVYKVIDQKCLTTSVSVSVAEKAGRFFGPMDESFIKSCDLCFHFVVASCGKMGKLKTADSCGTLAMSCVLRWRAVFVLFFPFQVMRLNLICKKN